MTTGYLSTQRLLLRRFTPADADALVALNADPAVTRFLNGGRPIPRDEVVAGLAGILRRYADSPGFGTWAGELRTTGEFLGWFALAPQSDSPPGEVELGYRLRAAAWGRGYGTEGAQALVRKAFTELGVRRVMATTMTVNTASRRVLEKAGLRFVRTFFADWPETIPGSEDGDVEYALTAEQWHLSLPANKTRPR